jgi:hypothetical protein
MDTIFSFMWANASSLSYVDAVGLNVQVFYTRPTFFRVVLWRRYEETVALQQQERTTSISLVVLLKILGFFMLRDI